MEQATQARLQAQFRLPSHWLAPRDPAQDDLRRYDPMLHGLRHAAACCHSQMRPGVEAARRAAIRLAVCRLAQRHPKPGERMRGACQILALVPGEARLHRIAASSF